jgi:hypothetical protein
MSEKKRNFREHLMFEKPPYYMKKQVKLALVIIAAIVLILTSFWYYKTKDLEPLIGIFTSVSGIIALSFTKTKESDSTKGLKQTQTTGDNSTAYQAGRDIQIKK